MTNENALTTLEHAASYIAQTGDCWDGAIREAESILIACHKFVGPLGEVPDWLQMNPNKVSYPFDLQECGFILRSAERGYNGNLPALYATGPDGQEWQFDGCFHSWHKVN